MWKGDAMSGWTTTQLSHQDGATYGKRRGGRRMGFLAAALAVLLAVLVASLAGWAGTGGSGPGRPAL